MTTRHTPHDPRMVIVKTSRYYWRWLGGKPEVHFELEGPVSLGELLSRLAREWPDFPRLPLQDRARLQAEVMIYQAGRFLRPDDLIAPGTTIELLPPIAGG